MEEESSAKSQTRLERLSVENELDALYDYFEPTEPGKYTGWLINMHAGDTINEDKKLVSCIHYYFLKQDGSRFKIRQVFKPYFYVQAKIGLENEILNFIGRRFEKKVNIKVEMVEKEDLDLNNHLSGFMG